MFLRKVIFKNFGGGGGETEKSRKLSPRKYEGLPSLNFQLGVDWAIAAPSYIYARVPKSKRHLISLTKDSLIAINFYIVHWHNSPWSKPARFSYFDFDSISIRLVGYESRFDYRFDFFQKKNKT